MTTRPDFSRFHAAPKCDPALLMDPLELLLDRPVRRQWSIPEPTREALLFVFILTVTIYVGWQSYQIGELRMIEEQVADLVATQATQAELQRIVGSEEALELMRKDRERAAVVRAIERAR